MGNRIGRQMSQTQKLNLLWTPAAYRDVIRLRKFLESKDSRAAQRASTTIRMAVSVIADNPYIKNKIEGREDRELFTPFGKNGYILRYRIEGENILLLRIWHARENREV